jgi:peptide alpha-N-acetyltransferase
MQMKYVTLLEYNYGETDALSQVVLETEITNTAAMKLYERLGFLRTKNLHRYYLNGNTAFRLVLYLKEGVGFINTAQDRHDPFDYNDENAPPPAPDIEPPA